MMYKSLLLYLILIFPLTAIAREEKEKSVKAEYTYVSDNKDESVKNAETNAFFRARCQAIEDEFGANVMGETDIITTNKNGHTSVLFRQRGGTEIRADWMKTVKEKVVSRSITDDGFMVIKVYVEGLAREITMAGVSLDFHLLRNGDNPENEDDRFRNDDRLSLTFQAPADGYLAVYITDDQKAYCVLPYKEQHDGIYRVKANKKYVFFSNDYCQESEKDYELILRLFTNYEHEINTVYVIYSQNPFTKATDDAGEEIAYLRMEPRNMKIDKFEDWLYECRQKDTTLHVEKKTITITKK